MFRFEQDFLIELILVGFLTRFSSPVYELPFADEKLRFVEFGIGRFCGRLQHVYFFHQNCPKFGNPGFVGLCSLPAWNYIRSYVRMSIPIHAEWSCNLTLNDKSCFITLDFHSLTMFSHHPFRLNLFSISNIIVISMKQILYVILA